MNREPSWDEAHCQNIFSIYGCTREIGKVSLAKKETLEVYYVMCPVCYERFKDRFGERMKNKNWEYVIIQVADREGIQ